MALLGDASTEQEGRIFDKVQPDRLESKPLSFNVAKYHHVPILKVEVVPRAFKIALPQVAFPFFPLGFGQEKHT